MASMIEVVKSKSLDIEVEDLYPQPDRRDSGQVGF